MAENVQCDDEFLRSIKALLWGSNAKEDVFKRWAQGKFSFLYFSVLVMVYSLFLIKLLLFGYYGTGS